MTHEDTPHVTVPLFEAFRAAVETLIQQDRLHNELFTLQIAQAALSAIREVDTMVEALKAALDGKGVLTASEFDAALAEYRAGVQVERALSVTPALADPHALEARIAELMTRLGCRPAPTEPQP
jgi:hypothetical protein